MSDVTIDVWMFGWMSHNNYNKANVLFTQKSKYITENRYSG